MNASPQFKVGLAVLAATAAGSLLYHIFDAHISAVMSTLANFLNISR